MNGVAPFWLDAWPPDAPFPPVELALREPDGLLAVGGDLSPQRLLRAYRQGIFPWYNAGQPILWWSPDPRLVLFPGALEISRSLRKTLRRGTFQITLDTDFEAVITACAAPRVDAQGTWITPDVAAAYTRLHALGHAHSVEVWRQGRLVGGLYGVALGRVFFGESMFTRASDASKVGFVHLVRQLQRWGFELIDCQVYTGHLARLGATLVSRTAFNAQLDTLTAAAGHTGSWVLDPDLADQLRGGGHASGASSARPS